MKKITIVLPSLNPDEKMTALVDRLVEAGFEDIVIVNDGSDGAHLKPFAHAKAYPACTVLNHETNKGKGRALKTAFAFVLNHRPDSLGVVTIDGDGQHQIPDIQACCTALAEETGEIVLGCRNFSEPGIPWRSRLGNRLTVSVFRFLCGLRISDTQTGLRGIPRAQLKELCKVQGERFEYETNMLLYIRKAGLGIREVKISTIYLDENRSSHFHPFRDSLKIYSAILRFSLSSLASSLLDIGLFSLLNFFLDPYFTRPSRIFTSAALARILSAIFNYGVNHKAVFQSRAPMGGTFWRYCLLCILQFFVSSGSVLLLSALLGSHITGDTVIKVIVDLVLFFISFRIQRDWVFADKIKGNGVGE